MKQTLLIISILLSFSKSPICLCAASSEDVLNIDHEEDKNNEVQLDFSDLEKSGLFECIKNHAIEEAKDLVINKTFRSLNYFTGDINFKALPLYNIHLGRINEENRQTITDIISFTYIYRSLKLLSNKYEQEISYSVKYTDAKKQTFILDILKLADALLQHFDLEVDRFDSLTTHPQVLYGMMQTYQIMTSINVKNGIFMKINHNKNTSNESSEMSRHNKEVTKALVSYHKRFEIYENKVYQIHEDFKSKQHLDTFERILVTEELPIIHANIACCTSLISFFIFKMGMKPKSTPDELFKRVETLAQIPSKRQAEVKRILSFSKDQHKNWIAILNNAATPTRRLKLPGVDMRSKLAAIEIVIRSEKVSLEEKFKKFQQLEILANVKPSMTALEKADAIINLFKTCSSILTSNRQAVMMLTNITLIHLYKNNFKAALVYYEKAQQLQNPEENNRDYDRFFSKRHLAYLQFYAGDPAPLEAYLAKRQAKKDREQRALAEQILEYSQQKLMELETKQREVEEKRNAEKKAFEARKASMRLLASSESHISEASSSNWEHTSQKQITLPAKKEKVKTRGQTQEPAEQDDCLEVASSTSSERKSILDNLIEILSSQKALTHNARHVLGEIKHDTWNISKDQMIQFFINIGAEIKESRHTKVKLSSIEDNFLQIIDPENEESTFLPLTNSFEFFSRVKKAGSLTLPRWEKNVPVYLRQQILTALERLGIHLEQIAPFLIKKSVPASSIKKPSACKKQIKKGKGKGKRK